MVEKRLNIEMEPPSLVLFKRQHSKECWEPQGSASMCGSFFVC